MLPYLLACGIGVLCFLIAYGFQYSCLPPPKVYHGGMETILGRMPMLKTSRNVKTLFPLCGWLHQAMQLLAMLVHLRVQETFSRRTFEVEPVPVTLEDGTCPDYVELHWLVRPQTISPVDAPILLVCPGIACGPHNLPFTTLYDHIPPHWRVAVYMKRGMTDASLSSPAIHLVGHPIDFRTAISHLTKFYPRAPLHVVSYSSGNGIVSSCAAMHSAKGMGISSIACFGGGCDYRELCPEDRMPFFTTFLFDVFLLSTAKYVLFGRRNRALLAEHDPEAYQSLLSSSTLQSFYDTATDRFSGYKDDLEANARINGLSGGVDRLCQNADVPLLHVFMEDDPLFYRGPSPSWRDSYSKGKKTACLVYAHGSHLACFQNILTGERWVDRLLVEWLQAV